VKVLITGGSGLLGQYLNLELSKKNKILTLYNSHPGNCLSFDSDRIDLSDWKALKEVFKKLRPDVVVHTAALSRPEICDEMPRELVFRINSELTENLSGLCADNNALLIFTSTDLVYDGNTGGMLTEDDAPNPESRYAESKLTAEEKVTYSGCKNVILRTSLLYGFGLNHSTNNFHAAYKKFKDGEKASLFYDQFRTPLALHDAARLIGNLIEKNIQDTLLNFGGRERVSRVELGEKLCEAAGFDKNLISGISMQDVKAIHRVADVSMNTEKLNSLGLIQKGVDESIREIISHKKMPE